MKYESAELTKISINILLASSINNANTLANICTHLGADWYEIMPFKIRQKDWKQCLY